MKTQLHYARPTTEFARKEMNKLIKKGGDEFKDHILLGKPRAIDVIDLKTKERRYGAGIGYYWFVAKEDDYSTKFDTPQEALRVAKSIYKELQQE